MRALLLAAVALVACEHIEAPSASRTHLLAVIRCESDCRRRADEHRKVHPGEGDHCGQDCERPPLRYYPAECWELLRHGQPCVSDAEPDAEQ